MKRCLLLTSQSTSMGIRQVHRCATTEAACPGAEPFSGELWEHSRKVVNHAAASFALKSQGKADRSPNRKPVDGTAPPGSAAFQPCATKRLPPTRTRPFDCPTLLSFRIVHMTHAIPFKGSPPSARATIEQCSRILKQSHWCGSTASHVLIKLTNKNCLAA